MKSPLKVAALQMATADDVSANEQRIRRAIDEAAEGGTELLAVPECALSGYLPAADLDFGRLGEAEGRLAAAAADAGMFLALGTTRARDDKWWNSVLLYSPAGDVVAAYDKTHLTDGDAKVFAPGVGLPVFQVGDWTLGLQICFDMRFPENWRILRRKGAELVIHLSSASKNAPWKVPVLEGAVRGRASENGMFVVSANDARAPQMMVSAVCDPDGCDLARAPENEEALLFAELDRSRVNGSFLSSRRTDLWNEPENRSMLLE